MTTAVIREIHRSAAKPQGAGPSSPPAPESVVAPPTRPGPPPPLDEDRRR